MSSIVTIAKALGISPSTVSRALKRPDMVSGETRHKILQEAQAQNYFSDRGVNTEFGYNKFIGILVADLTNSFSNTIVKVVQDFAYSHNYTPLIGCTYEQPSIENKILNQWDLLNLKGIVAMPLQSSAEAYQEVAQKIPLVLVDRQLDNVKCDTVIVNNRSGIRQALDHLTNLGHKNITLICGSNRIYTFNERAQAAHEYGNNINVTTINAVSYEELYMGAFEQVNMLMMSSGKNRPTALIGANNAITAGILYALNLKGIKIPGDISVLAYGDSHWGRFYPVPITSIRQPTEEMGEYAATILFERIHGKQEDFKNICLEPMLLPRVSTAAVSTC